MLKLMKEQFQQKRKYANLILFLQIIVLIIAAIWAFFGKGSSHYFYSLDGAAFSSYWQADFQSNSFSIWLADFAFAITSAYCNERINRSQTWRLIPVSANKLWLSNILSSLLTCIYLFISQLILLFLTALPAKRAFAYHNPLFSTLNAFWLYPTKDNNWSLILNRIIFIFALAFFVYACVSLVDFAGQAIVAFLPVKNAKWAELLVAGLLTIVVITVASDAWGHFANFMLKQSQLHRTWVHQFGSPLWLSNLLIWGINLLFALLDLWLFSHFVESKTDV